MPNGRPGDRPTHGLESQVPQSPLQMRFCPPSPPGQEPDGTGRAWLVYALLSEYRQSLASPDAASNSHRSSGTHRSSCPARKAHASPSSHAAQSRVPLSCRSLQQTPVLPSAPVATHPPGQSCVVSHGHEREPPQILTPSGVAHGPASPADPSSPSDSLCASLSVPASVATGLAASNRVLRPPQPRTTASTSAGRTADLTSNNWPHQVAPPQRSCTGWSAGTCRWCPRVPARTLRP